MSVVQSEAARREISAEWTRAGGGFTVEPAAYPVDIEELLVRTAIQAPADHRLFFLAATWLGRHHHLVDLRRLGRLFGRLEGMPSAVAGSLLSVANEMVGSARLGAAARLCRPLAEPRVLFERTAAHPVLSAFARENALPLFVRWGLWHDELSFKCGAVRPIRWILESCPELRIRALIGANLDGEIVEALREEPRTVADLARATGASYAATHEAASRLMARGLVAPVDGGQKTGLALPKAVEMWLEAFPAAAVRTQRGRRGAA